MHKPYFCQKIFLTDWRHKRLKNTTELLLFYVENFYGFSESGLRSFLVYVARRILTIDKKHSFTLYKILACFLYYAAANNWCLQSVLNHMPIWPHDVNQSTWRTSGQYGDFHLSWILTSFSASDKTVARKWLRRWLRRKIEITNSSPLTTQHY